MKKLKVISGKDKDRGREFPLPANGTLVLGRALETHTQFVDQLISGTHCRVEVNGDAVYVVDNNSSNGTFVGADDTSLVRLEPHRAVELQNGQFVRLGSDTTLQFIDESVHIAKTQRADEAMLARIKAAQQTQGDGSRRAGERGTHQMPALGPMGPGSLAGPGTTPPGGPSQGPAVPPTPRRQLPPGSLSVNCSHCGQQLVAREQYAGMQVRCPTCHNLVTLPGRPGSTPPLISAPAMQPTPPMPLPGSSGNMPILPQIPLPAGTAPGMPPLPPGPMAPPSVDAFQMPYPPPSRPWRPIHLVLLTIPVVLLVVTVVIVVKLLMG